MVELKGNGMNCSFSDVWEVRDNGLWVLCLVGSDEGDQGRFPVGDHSEVRGAG